MPDNKVKSQYLENSERQRMAVIKDMERNPSPMTKAFLRPPYNGTEACPIYCRRPSKGSAKTTEKARDEYLIEAKEKVTIVELDIGNEKPHSPVVSKLLHIENLIEQVRSDLEEG